MHHKKNKGVQCILFNFATAMIPISVPRHAVTLTTQQKGTLTI